MQFCYVMTFYVTTNNKFVSGQGEVFSNCIDAFNLKNREKLNAKQTIISLKTNMYCRTKQNMRTENKILFKV